PPAQVVTSQSQSQSPAQVVTPQPQAEVLQPQIPTQEPQSTEPVLPRRSELAPSIKSDEPAVEQSDAPVTPRRKAFNADRRAHKRVPLSAPMRFRFNGQTFVARSADVSMGGMFIETSESLSSGFEITVLFSGSEGFPIELDARVMYVMKGVGVGVKFFQIPDTDQKYLEALIEGIDQELKQ
ncbi:PilZ domain-containing protein, partial [Acidobacteriota bacterium]